MKILLNSNLLDCSFNAPISAAIPPQKTTVLGLCYYCHADRVNEPGIFGSCQCLLGFRAFQTLRAGLSNSCIVSAGAGYSLPLSHTPSHHEVTLRMSADHMYLGLCPPGNPHFTGGTCCKSVWLHINAFYVFNINVMGSHTGECGILFF